MVGIENKEERKKKTLFSLCVDKILFYSLFVLSVLLFSFVYGSLTYTIHSTRRTTSWAGVAVDEREVVFMLL